MISPFKLFIRAAPRDLRFLFVVLLVTFFPIRKCLFGLPFENFFFFFFLGDFVEFRFYRCVRPLFSRSTWICSQRHGLRILCLTCNLQPDRKVAEKRGPAVSYISLRIFFLVTISLLKKSRSVYWNTIRLSSSFIKFESVGIM